MLNARRGTAREVGKQENHICKAMKKEIELKKKLPKTKEEVTTLGRQVEGWNEKKLPMSLKIRQWALSRM